MQSLLPETLSSIIGDIYDCVINPDGWVQALTRINQAMNGAYTTISLTDPAFLHPRMAAHSPWDSQMLKILNEEYGVDGVPGLREVAFGDIDTPQSSINQLGESAFYASPFYRNWVQPQGLRDACVMTFVRTADRIGAIATATWASRDVVTADERRFMQLLAPHIRRAAMIGDLLDYQRVQAESFRAAVHQLKTPVILVGHRAKVLFANNAAQLMLQQQLLLTLRDGCLCTTHDAVTVALQDALLRCGAQGKELGGRGIGIPLVVLGQPAAVAYVLPLQNRTLPSGFDGATAAVFVSVAQHTASPPHQVLAALYDLTPAEARVMVLVGSGLSTGNAAVTLGVSENTVKTHLSRVFVKANVTRQTRLMQLVRSLASPVPN